MVSQQNGCCLQAIAVILADIILFLSDWLCSSQYFVVGFALQEEFLLEGSWRTVSHDVNRGTSPQAVSAALLGGVVCAYVSACNKKYCIYWSQAAAAGTQGFPLMFSEHDSSPHKLTAHHLSVPAQAGFQTGGVAYTAAKRCECSMLRPTRLALI